MADGSFNDRLASYASAGLRWGLLLEDHPDAVRRFSEAKGADLVPPFSTRYADRQFVICEIEIPGHAMIHTGVKEIPRTVRRRDGNSGNYKNVPWDDTYDNFQVLQTQACGRALRDAGYPHSLPDLKMVILWRRRNAEVDSLMTALDAAAGEHEDDDEEEDAPPVTTTTTRPITPEQHVPGNTIDIMAPVLADDAMRNMWDQMPEPVREEFRTWLAAQSGFKPVTVRAYMKHLLEREHVAKMHREPEQATDWVSKAVDAIADPKTGGEPPEMTPQDAEQAALLEGIAEVRGRLREMAAKDAATYATVVAELSRSKIEMSDRLTMEQLIEVDEIVSHFEKSPTEGNVDEPADVQ